MSKTNKGSKAGDEQLYAMPVFHNWAVGMVTGQDRQRLRDDAARQRWDYFFRPSALHIWVYHADEIVPLLRAVDEASRTVRRARRPMWIPLFLGLALLGLLFLRIGSDRVLDMIGRAAGDQQGVVPIVVGTAGFLLVVVALGIFLPRLLDARSRRRRATSEYLALDQKLAKMARHGVTTLPTGRQIRAVIANLAPKMCDRARDQLQIPPERKKMHTLPPVWALQRGSRAQVQSFPVHARAFQVDAEVGIVYASYAFQFIFLMDDYLAVHTELYDVIADESLGFVNAVYYYHDVAAIEHEARREVVNLNKDKQFTQRVNTLTLVLNSGQGVSFGLYDAENDRTLAEAVTDEIERAKLNEQYKNAPADVTARSDEEARRARDAASSIGQDSKNNEAQMMVRNVRSSIHDHKRNAGQS